MRVPVFTEPSPDEKRIAELQLAYNARMRRSQYYLVEKTKTTGERDCIYGQCAQAEAGIRS